MNTPNIVICGAGYAGISAAYHLAVKHRQSNIILIDERAPLTLTSNKSTETYHDWWAQPSWRSFIQRSLDLLDQLATTSGNRFQLNRRGYLYATTNPDHIADMQAKAAAIGELRHHDGKTAYLPNMPASPKAFHSLPTGADLFTNPQQLQRQFHFLSKKTVAALHVRRAGWFDANKLGNWLLDQALAHGVQLKRDRVEGVGSVGGRVRTIFLASGERLDTNCFVVAVGPHLREMGLKMGLDLPVQVTLQGKISWQDNAGIIPRNAPLTIHHNPTHPFSAGIRLRPHNKKTISITYTPQPQTTTYPLYPMPFPAYYAKSLLQGITPLIPGLSVYHQQLDQINITGGYNCHTPDNRPLIGPLPLTGAYVIGALSDYGLMASQAAGELLAAHITQEPLPVYAGNFHPNRYG